MNGSVGRAVLPVTEDGVGDLTQTSYLEKRQANAFDSARRISGGVGRRDGHWIKSTSKKPLLIKLQDFTWPKDKKRSLMKCRTRFGQLQPK